MFPRCSCLPEPPRSCFMSAFEFSGTVYQGKSCQGSLLRREKSKHRRTSSFFAFILFFHRPHFLLQGSSKPIPYQAVAFFTFDFLLSKIKIKLMKIYSKFMLLLWLWHMRYNVIIDWKYRIYIELEENNATI